ncbi:21649_t:CDS:2, partial [Gigaspora margarita]
MSTHNFYQSSSYNSDTVALSKNIHNLESKSSLSSPDQTPSQNSSVTITNITNSKRPKSKKPSWVWHYFKQDKVAKKVCCKVEIIDKDSIKKACAHEYESTTGTGCTAHMIQLILEDGFDIEEVSNLINKAKTLNSYINDLRFKNMNYITPSKKRETIAHLYTLFDTQERPSSIQKPQTSNT